MQHTSGTSVAVVADDATGAADAALAFAETGWTAHLELAGAWTPPEGAHTAAALSTDSRAAPDARDATERAVRTALAAGADRVYLKIDSTGRGTIADQIAGARAALGDPLTVLCPAFPAVGRTVAAEHLLVDGADAAAGPAGTDPVTPLATGDLTVLVPGARAVDRLVPGAAGIVVLDAEVDEDLDRIAASIAILERRQPVLAVGSAGLARALARVWHPTPHDVTVPPVPTDLVVVSSLNPATRAQTAHAVRHGIAHTVLDVPNATDAELEAAIRALPRPAIASTSAVRDPQGAQHLAHRLGTAAARAVQATQPKTVGLVGGDGAAAALAALGAPRALVAGRIAPGVPLLRLPGLDVWTKAGGFGPPGLLTDLIQPAH
ncbi:four-carbon acid sugar kinase family protein [Glycomyces sp. NPDC047010]|uniref:four-carbon acid sugar kinase family protein n=1 Tax=Glycomyces sp. NPDC047010 TaxID=3155023 RepID=UPI0033C0AD99